MDFVRSDNCHRIRSRAAPSVVRDPSGSWSFEKLGRYDRGTRAGFTDESSLVELVRVSPGDRAHFHLDECSNAKKRHAGTVRLSSNLCALDRDLLLDHLAGALGIFFRFDFCAGASGLARADQVRRRSLDRVRVVDVSDLARLGRTALAKRSAIG